MEENLQVMYEDEAMKRSDFALFIMMRAFLEEQTQRTIFDEKLAKAYFPKVKVVYLDCAQTMWALRHTRRQVESKWNELVTRGCSPRMMRFIDVEEANHFVSDDS